DRGANRVTQYDLSRLHSNLLPLMLLNARGCQLPADALHRGISWLQVYGEAQGTSEAEHGHIGRENNTDHFTYPRAHGVLQQRREEPPAEPLALPCIGKHERYVCAGF